MKSKECKHCGATFSTKDCRKQFCNSTCSATFNNTHRSKKTKVCENCGQSRNRGKKFCSVECQQMSHNKERITSGVYSAKTAKKYLCDLDNRCSICRIESEWNGKSLVMILDHIDGNAENNDLSNLRLVCPNCDSQLDTFKSRNRGNGRHSRKTRYNLGLSY